MGCTEFIESVIAPTAITDSMDSVSSFPQPSRSAIAATASFSFHLSSFSFRLSSFIFSISLSNFFNFSFSSFNSTACFASSVFIATTISLNSLIISIAIGEWGGTEDKGVWEQSLRNLSGRGRAMGRSTQRSLEEKIFIAISPTFCAGIKKGGKLLALAWFFFHTTGINI